MGLPEPVIGLVINFPYLFASEQEEGKAEGKFRPCTIVSSIKVEGCPTKVMVAPITHSEPKDKRGAVELPDVVAQRIGLDKSWIICDEANEFDWPSPDMRRVPRSNFNPFAYGVLGGKTMAKVRKRFLNTAEGFEIKVVSRN
jgi:hypothetical protein